MEEYEKHANAKSSCDSGKSQAKRSHLALCTKDMLALC